MYPICSDTVKYLHVRDRDRFERLRPGKQSFSSTQKQYPWGTRGLRLEEVLRIHMRVVKGDWNGAVSRSTAERLTPCRCFEGHIKEPYETSMAWKPDRRFNFLFSPPAHLCRHIYNWNIFAWDVKQPISPHLTKATQVTGPHLSIHVLSIAYFTIVLRKRWSHLTINQSLRWRFIANLKK